MLEHKIAQLEERLLDARVIDKKRRRQETSSRSAPTSSCATSTPRRPSSTTSSARPRPTRPSTSSRTSRPSARRSSATRRARRSRCRRPAAASSSSRSSRSRQPEAGFRGAVARSSGFSRTAAVPSDDRPPPTSCQALPRPRRDRRGPGRVRAARGGARRRRRPPHRGPCDGAPRHGEARLPRPRRPHGPDPGHLRDGEDGRDRRRSSATSSASRGVPARDAPRRAVAARGRRVELLSRNTQPLPDTFHGLTDVEQRYRKRYLDLLVNEETREDFVLRARIVSAVRALPRRRGLRRGRDAGAAAPLRRRVRAARSSRTTTSSTRTSTSGSRPSSTSSG